MVRRTTWILLGAFAVVVLASAGWRRFTPAPAEATPTMGPESPWSISPEQVESIRLTDLSDPGGVVLRRDRAPPPRRAGAGRRSGSWPGPGPRAVRPVAGAVPDDAPDGGRDGAFDGRWSGRSDWIRLLRPGAWRRPGAHGQPLQPGRPARFVGEAALSVAEA